MPDVPAPPDPSRRRDALAHREAILDAAQVVLARDGGGTMTDVAGAAGLTRATVYRHFPDRDAVLDGLVARLAGPLVDEALAEVARGPLPEAMGRLGRRVGELLGRHRRLVGLIGPRLDVLARAAVDDEPLTAALRRRREAGELHVPVSDAWLAACVRSLCLAAAADDRDPALVTEDLAETLRRLVA